MPVEFPETWSLPVVRCYSATVGQLQFWWRSVILFDQIEYFRCPAPPDKERGDTVEVSQCWVRSEALPRPASCGGRYWGSWRRSWRTYMVGEWFLLVCCQLFAVSYRCSPSLIGGRI